jgi:hypothetical protein
MRKTVFSTHNGGTGHLHGKKERKKKNLDTDFIPFIKINSKLIIDLNVKFKIQNYETEMVTREKNQDDLGFGYDFLDVNTKGILYEKIIDKLDFIKTKYFCFVKTLNWEKIFAKDY